jgi:hypothetical protein
VTLLVMLATKNCELHHVMIAINCKSNTEDCFFPTAAAADAAFSYLLTVDANVFCLQF